MKNFTKILLLFFIAIAGVLFFQAQDYMFHNSDDNNPNIDQPTLESKMHYHTFPIL